MFSENRFEEIAGGFDEEDKKTLNDSIYDLFEDDEVL